VITATQLQAAIESTAKALQSQRKRSISHTLAKWPA
jgi:hypothetical protein